MLNKTIRILYYSLFLATPLLMLSSTSELFEFNKMLFIYLIALAILFVWLLKMFSERRFFVRRTVIDIPVLIFLASQILSTIFSIDRHTSLFGYYGRFNGGLVSTVAYLVLFYGFVTLFDKAYREKLLKWSLFSSFLVILWGLPGRFGHDLSCLLYSGQFNNTCWTDQFRPAERMFSTLGQPNWLGAYLAINFFIGLYFFLKKGHSETESKNPISSQILHFVQDDKKKFLMFGFYLLVNFSGILFSRSRSALIAVAVGFILFFILTYLTKEGKKILQNSIKWTATLIALLLVAVLLFKTGIDKVDRILSFQRAAKPVSQVQSTSKEPQLSSEITESLDIRKIVWKGAIELGKKYPLFGTGVETFAYSYYFVRPVEHNLTSEWDYLYNKAHNEYLNYLATTGFVGLFAYLFLIGTVLFTLFRLIFRKKVESDDSQLLATALLSAYVTILITNFFGFSTTTINIFFYILIPGTIVARDLILERDFAKRTSFYGFIAGNIVLLYLFVSLILYFVADINYASGINYAKVGDYQQAAFYLNKAIGLHYEHVYEDKYSYYLANLAFIAAYQKQNDLVSKLVNLSTLYNSRSINASPSNVGYWKTRGKDDYLFYQINLDRKYLDDGVKALNQAEKLAPTDPKLPYSLAIYYSLLNDEVTASKDSGDKDKGQLYKTLSVNNIEKSIELKSDYRDAYFLKAQLLKKYGEKEEARQTLEFILQKLNPQDKEASDELKTL